jgi:hypothetical protein
MTVDLKPCPLTRRDPMSDDLVKRLRAEIEKDNNND